MKMYLYWMILCFIVQPSETNAFEPSKSLSVSEVNIDSLYKLIQPANQRPSYEVFTYGLQGYYALLNEGKLNNTQYLSIIDFSLPSHKRRFWVIDMNHLKVVHKSVVAHGKNTGGDRALKFSNIPRSNMSSLGFYITGSTYHGKYGLSLYLDGVEKGINDNARKRTIVMHSAKYATWDFIRKYGRLGRSFGCPALPPSKSSLIINTIKNKSCLFIFYPDKDYFNKSKYVHSSI